MKKSSVWGRYVTLLAVALSTLWAFAPMNLEAQEDATSQRTPLERQHPYLADLLEAFDSAHHLILAEVAAHEGVADVAGSDPRLYERVVRDILATPNRSVVQASTVTGGEEGGRAVAVVAQRILVALERVNAFHHDLVNAYVNPDVVQADEAAEHLVNVYLSDPESALLPDPKDMAILSGALQAGAFSRDYPRLHGLIWAHHWLQLAAFEPLIRYQTPEMRRAGVLAVVARFWSMLEEPTESFPTQMPMAPTIARSLVARQPRAAALLDNSGMFRDAVLDVLAGRSPADHGEALEMVIQRFQDPGYLTTSFFDWNHEAIISGVGNQGGWALNIIPDPERTDVKPHMMHRMAKPMVGM
jgi:hypothetical protein